jgi:hypothetical protein
VVPSALDSIMCCNSQPPTGTLPRQTKDARQLAPTEKTVLQSMAALIKHKPTANKQFGRNREKRKDLRVDKV